MKKNIKKIGMSLLCTAILTGCGESSDSSKKDVVVSPMELSYEKTVFEDAEKLIDYALNKMDNLDSLSSTLDVEMNMSMMGQEMLTQTITTANNFLNPAKLQLSMDIITHEGVQNLEMYVEENRKSIDTYLLSTNNEWSYEAITDEDLISLLAHKQVTEILPKLNNSYIDSKKTDDNGIKKYTIKGFLDFDAMMHVAILNGTLATAEMLGMTEVDLMEVIEPMENLEIYVIIGDNGLIYEYGIDMYSMLQGLMDMAMEKSFGIPANELAELDMNVVVNKSLVKISMYNYNNVDEFEIPLAAKN